MWIRFNLAFAFTLVVAIGGTLLFVLLVDPLGVSPVALISDRYVVYNDRRQAMPQIIRSKRYDSFIVGSSTVITADPAWVESAFGGKFANVAIQGATPYEQSSVIGLIARQNPRMIIHGLDADWCAPGASRYHPWWPFPEWLYSEVRLSDMHRLLNWHIVRLAIDKVRLALGLDPPVVFANGFDTQWPKDSEWNLEKAQARLYSQDGKGAHAASGETDASPIPPSLSRHGSFPSVEYLSAMAAKLPPSTKLVILFMPVHAAALPPAGSDLHNRLKACKERVAEIAHRPNTHVIDFMVRSPTTQDDTRFWDRIHLRSGSVRSLVERAREAIERRESAGDGTYRYLAGPTHRPGASNH